MDSDIKMIFYEIIRNLNTGYLILLRDGDNFFRCDSSIVGYN